MAAVARLSAFVPKVAGRRAGRASAVAVRASSGQEYMKSLPGVCAPTGFFDPLNFTGAPTFTVSEAKRFREAELTHGRVSMLAVLGWIVAEEYHPLFGGEIGGPAFRHFQEIEAIVPQFWEFVILVIGICESVRISAGWNSLSAPATEQIKESYAPGELGFDPLGLLPTDAAAKFELQTKEINNGRLAMISIAGFAVQEEVDHITIWRGLVEEKIIPAEDANLLPF